jgi:hypothetical protein
MTTMQIFEAVAKRELTPEQGAALMTGDRSHLGHRRMSVDDYIGIGLLALLAFGVWAIFIH